METAKVGLNAIYDRANIVVVKYMAIILMERISGGGGVAQLESFNNQRKA